ncbi:MAG: hypothetical protein ACQEQC_08195 [Elusimicrobiota bacterium]
MIKNKILRNWYDNLKDKNSRELTRVLDVEYAHLILENKDDLYLTKYGLPYMENLKPKNFWTDKEWFRNNSVKLSGTSTLYKVRTKKINNKSRDIVLKWNRMGQEIPGLEENSDLINAEFNSPFEEFSLVMELRSQIRNLKEKLALQKPLAIYVPAASKDPFKLGRKEYKMKNMIASHTEIELDICRPYAMVYEWIDGIDLTRAYGKNILDKFFMERLTVKAEQKLRNYGYVVQDSKPHHIIIRPREEKGLLSDKDGRIIFGLVDYELLNRLPNRDTKIKRLRRAEYLKRQRDRFTDEHIRKFHPHLDTVEILGVNYIHGDVGSTRGRLWVVGKDPFLYDYFLPERWEHTPRKKISKSRDIYHTTTKDNINIVWKISKVGIKPDMDPYIEVEKNVLEFGYNSPFEEFSIAMDLTRKGVLTIYPRAVYMTGTEMEIPQHLYDESRYKSHRDLKISDGRPVLIKDREYIVIWGYWNGPDELLAEKDEQFYKAVDLLSAYKQGMITQDRYLDLIESMKDNLKNAGYRALNLRGNHILLSIDCSGNIVMDDGGKPELRICNFEFIKKI